MAPKVSVVLPVYNDEKYIKEAIESILTQSFSDFELIIINDRSTDNTAAVVKSILDPRVKFYTNEKNLGRAGSDNYALTLIQGKYVAKMDSDDVCLPERFERQVKFLDNNPEINVVGSWMQNFGASNFLNKYPEDPKEAKCFTLFGLPVGNPSIMLRANLFKDKGLRYDEKLRQTEDFDFFARYVNDLVVSTLPEALIKYRNYPNTAKEDILTERGAVSHQVRENFLKNWGIPFSGREAGIHHAIAHSNPSLADTQDFNEYQTWLLKIYDFNKTNPLFDAKTLQHLLAVKWFYLCYFNPGKRLSSFLKYEKSFLKKYYSIPANLRFKFLLRGIINFM